MPSRGGNCQRGDFAKNASDHANLWPSTCVSILKRPLMDSDERKLIERVRAGDLAAFKDIVESYQRPVFNFAMQLTGDWDDADDISQQVFIKAYRNLGRFQGDAKVMSWLLRIAVNTHIDEVRRRKSQGGWVQRPATAEDNPRPEHFVATAAGDDPERQAVAGQMQEHIQQALGTLAPRQRSIFVLRHYHDLPLKEIAGILGVSLGTVKSQLFRALGRTNDNQIVPVLLELARNDPHIQVRTEAAAALGRLDTPEARQALIQLLEGK